MDEEGAQSSFETERKVFQVKTIFMNMPPNLGPLLVSRKLGLCSSLQAVLKAEVDPLPSPPMPKQKKARPREMTGEELCKCEAQVGSPVPPGLECSPATRHCRGCLDTQKTKPKAGIPDFICLNIYKEQEPLTRSGERVQEVRSLPWPAANPGSIQSTTYGPPNPVKSKP